jgi:hypothetical protein
LLISERKKKEKTEPEPIKQFGRWNDVYVSVRDHICTFLDPEDRLLLGASSKTEKSHLSRRLSWHTSLHLDRHMKEDENYDAFVGRVVLYYPANHCQVLSLRGVQHNRHLRALAALAAIAMPSVQRLKVHGMGHSAFWFVDLFSDAVNLRVIELVDVGLEAFNWTALAPCQSLKTLIFNTCTFWCHCNWCRLPISAEAVPHSPCLRGLQCLDLPTVTTLEFNQCITASAAMIVRALAKSGKCKQLDTLNVITHGQAQTLALEYGEGKDFTLPTLKTITVTETENKNYYHQKVARHAAAADLYLLLHLLLVSATNATLTVNGFDDQHLAGFLPGRLQYNKKPSA